MISHPIDKAKWPRDPSESDWLKLACLYLAELESSSGFYFEIGPYATNLLYPNPSFTCLLRSRSELTLLQADYAEASLQIQDLGDELDAEILVVPFENEARVTSQGRLENLTEGDEISEVFEWTYG